MRTQFIHWWIWTCWKLHVTFYSNRIYILHSEEEKRQFEIYFNFVPFDIMLRDQNLYVALNTTGFQNKYFFDWDLFIRFLFFINSIMKCVYEWLCKFSLYFFSWHSLKSIEIFLLFPENFSGRWGRVKYTSLHVLCIELEQKRNCVEILPVLKLCFEWGLTYIQSFNRLSN